MRRWAFAAFGVLGLALVAWAWFATVGLAHRRRASMEFVCPCLWAEADVRSENGRLRIVCVCPAREGR